MGKLPFDSGIFWKTLAVVVVLVIITWVLVIKLSEYEITTADYVGTTISTIIFSYLIHLWIMPVEKLRGDPSDNEQPSVGAEDGE